ncbi:hypothetical protein E1287_14710 [Actinomadura sp. KC06]|uniref:DUF6338 family protein n=1 Tax=Actinomadura sp. KC06 TaxID=2530369 RepID=UPI00105399BE|nr:DUF6338 family protein [Actinomadura sp. KC06]TDD35163.1 hypothetical protein E1287_14710 [Actinomadura sp. KC06]
MPIVLLVLAALPGLHFDQIRGGGERGRTGNPRPQFARVVIAGTLITTGTLMVLGLLGRESQLSLRRLLDENATPLHSPLVAAWSIACFLGFSLTLSAFAAVVLTRLENRPGPVLGLPRTSAAARAAAVRADYSDREIELEITLNSGQTYRGMLGEECAAGRGHGVRFIVLYGPIFQLDGHGKPLPLDALHWDQMIVPTRAVTSVLLRPIDEPPAAPPPSVTFRGVASRHSAPRTNLTDQLKTLIERCYEGRLAPRALAKVLAVQIVLIALVGALSSAFS